LLHVYCVYTVVQRLCSTIFRGKFVYCVYIVYSVVPHLHHNCTRNREGDSDGIHRE